MGIRICGVGGYVPEAVLTNHALAARVDTSHEWVVRKTGITERRIAAAGEQPSDMGCRAALGCLEHAGLDKAAVDLLVVASATHDQPQPTLACVLQDKLGIAAQRCPAFDVSSVCAGFVYALAVAQSLMLTDPKRFRHALVVGSDAFSRIVDWRDRGTCVFFGDGAGAVLLTHNEEDDRRIHFRLGSDGRGRRAIEVPAGGTFTMDGPAVWEFAVRTVPVVVRALLAERGLQPADLALLILHQSNLRMIEAILQSLGMSVEQTFTTVENYGNTAAASIPLTLAAAQAAGRLRPGARVMLCGFGGGLSWGAALLEW
jgi:3-oxoacyl-[acyl-carrier-protein] synthase-3